MALDLRWLEQVPILRIRQKVYFRHVKIPASGPADPFLVRPNDGRWQSLWTLYTASHPETAWAEYCRNSAADVAAADITGGVGIDPLSLAALGPLRVGPPLPERALFELTYSFERLADLLSPWGQTCLTRAGFPLGDFYADGPGYGACPQVAAAAAPLGWEAIRAPSAALRTPEHYCVAVFEAGRDRLDHYAEAVPAASPTVAVAYASTYPLGKRPAWLSTS